MCAKPSRANKNGYFCAGQTRATPENKAFAARGRNINGRIMVCNRSHVKTKIGTDLKRASKQAPSALSAQQSVPSTAGTSVGRKPSIQGYVYVRTYHSCWPNFNKKL